MKSKVGILLAAGAVALLGIALFVPWYQYGTEWRAETSQVDFYVVIQFKFEELVYIQHEDGVETSSRTVDYGWNMYPEIGEVMSTQRVFAVAALLTAIAFLGTAVVNYRKLMLAVGIATIAVCVISAGYLYVSIEDAFHSLTPSYSLVDGFWGSSGTLEDGRTSWGPALGWYLTVVSAAVMLTAAVLLARRTAKSPSAERSASGEPPHSQTGLSESP